MRVHTFRGSSLALGYAFRDLECLEHVIALTPGRSVAVQAGGNLGIWPKRLAQYFAAVYTFEPDGELFEALTQNAQERNIFKFQAALGASSQFVGLSRARRDGSGRPTHEGLTHIEGDGPIPTLRVDDFGFPVCDLLYLDTEGTELAILKGAAQTIARCRPVLAVEINKSLEYLGLTAQDVRAYIYSLGYVGAKVFRSDEVFIPEEWRGAA